jgi:hypothetical protein
MLFFTFSPPIMMFTCIMAMLNKIYLLFNNPFLLEVVNIFYYLIMSSTHTK